MAAGRFEAVDWQEVFPGLRLLEALRLALRFRSLVLAAAGMVLMVAGWWVLGQAFAGSSNDRLASDILAYDVWPWDWAVAQELDAEMVPERVPFFDAWFRDSPLIASWHVLSSPFVRAYEAEITATHFVYLLAAAMWSLAVWSFFGGAITRQAAVGFARHENVSLRALVGHVAPRWGSYFAAPLFPILGTFLLAGLLAALGALMRIEVGVVVAGVVWPIALVIGFLMAFLLLGLFFSWPLMWATISTEGTDAFGALSHAYSYVYQRPLRYLLYAVVAAFAGVLGWHLVWLFAMWIVELTNWGVSWGGGTELLANIKDGKPLNGRTADFGASMIRFWQGAIHTLALAFGPSYLWVSTTVIYFLLRRTVDAAELDEVFLGEGREQHTLPPLKADARGVPDVAEGPTVGSGPDHGATSSG